MSQGQLCYREQFWKRVIEVNSWITDPTSKRRDKLAIVADILEIAMDGTLKTQIMYKANLSFVQLNEYLEYMQNNHLLNKLDINNKEVYITTEKGLDFLQKHSELTQLLDKESKNGKNGVKVPPQSLLKRI
jgi:predicted transcriptional regulator